ncbi:septation protein IspZ [Orbaceae bacterium ESL0721]|nr:septation protein IspZ [Orbaceae bacterium ESL0721]
MKQLLNFIPLLFFFTFLMLYDIFAGVEALMITATISFFITLIIYKKIEKVELFSYLMIIIFGGLTLYLREPDFIKWKVTIINFLFALILLISQLFFKKNLLKKTIGKEVPLDDASWNRLNYLWSLFFMLCGIANIYVTFYTSTDFFAIFKTFILPGSSLLLAAISGIYIYIQTNKNSDN